jgi:DNA-binding Lrp family transcriptional regulator
MRFAPPPSLRIADKSGGLNQISVRSFNERLIMSLLIQNKGLSRLELGKKSGLSAQTISVIVRALEKDGLVSRGEAQRGRVGPPTIPMSLNPGGAFSLGVSVGSRVTNVVLIDFIGNVRFRDAIYYDHANLDFIKKSLTKAVPKIINDLGKKFQNRIIGMGIALPETIQIWPDNSSKSSWKGFDFEVFLQSFLDVPVYVQNDVTAATSAESIFGQAKSLDNYLFFFLGARSHNRLVLNHRIYAGTLDQDKQSVLPNILELEQQAKEQNVDVSKLWHYSADWSELHTPLDKWTADYSKALIKSTSELCRYIDVKKIVIAGIMPPAIQKHICQLTAKELSDTQVIAASVGPLGKAIGAASLPFISRFMVQDDFSA